MKVRFLKKHKHRNKTFQKGDAVPVSVSFGSSLVKRKIAEEFTGDLQEETNIKLIKEGIEDGN